MNGHSEGYKRTVDQNWGCVAKIGFFGQKPRFWAQKKHTLLYLNHIPAMTGKSCSKKKVAFSQIKKKNTFRLNVKTAVFAVIPARPGSVVILGHFFDGLDGSTKFR